MNGIFNRKKRTSASNVKRIAVIGAGPAGIEAASVLASAGMEVNVFEKAALPCRNLADKAFLFPDFSPASEIVKTLSEKLLDGRISVKCDCGIVSLSRERDGAWRLDDDSGGHHYADSVIVATGYTPFDARRKEELGYGIYKGVHTSLEMENMILSGNITNAVGEPAGRIAFLQCVGSRDEKTGNHYCSKICCITAVKQAIEVRKRLPEAEIYVFYMDLRMWGQGFEELYRSAQQDWHIRFVRGRISEAGESFDGRVQIKAEDTLMGLPLKMTVDVLTLMVGMEASDGTRRLSSQCGLCDSYGFFKTLSPHLEDNATSLPGLFAAGTCKRPLSLSESILDGRAAALAVLSGPDV